MKKRLIGVMVFCCFNAYSSPTNCEFKKMTPLEKGVVSFFKPFDSCKEVRTQKGKLVGIIQMFDL